MELRLAACRALRKVLHRFRGAKSGKGAAKWGEGLERPKSDDSRGGESTPRD